MIVPEDLWGGNGSHGRLMIGVTCTRNTDPGTCPLAFVSGAAAVA